MFLKELLTKTIKKEEDGAAPGLQVVDVGEGQLRCVVVSDTHGRERELPSLGEGHLLLHCGDATHKAAWKRGDGWQRTADFLEWMFEQRFEEKVLIAGNHEMGWAMTEGRIREMCAAKGLHYLRDEEITLFGLRIYGSPWTSSRNMAFSGIGDHFDAIPQDLDVLMTHMPPLNIKDLAWSNRGRSFDKCETCGKVHPNYRHWGSSKLLAAPKPRVHVFGHVHDDTGHVYRDTVHYINAACEMSLQSYTFQL